MANKNEVKIIVTADTKGAEAGIKGLTAQLRSHWLELSAMAAGAFFTIKKLYDEFAAAAEREERRMAFTNLAATFHMNAESIIADLKRMSGQSITESRAIEIAGKAMMSGFDPRAMSGLMEFAKTMSNITGMKPADTFEDLTRAIITGQDRMLRMQGITVDFDKAQKDLAASLGGTKEQLNEQQVQYANLTAMLDAAIEMTQRMGQNQHTMADEIDKTSTEMSESLEKVKNAIYQAFGPPAIVILREFARELDQLNYLINFGKAAYERVKGLFTSGEPAAAAESTAYSLVNKGATSLEDLGFTFDMESALGPGLQSLKEYTEEMKSSLGEITKSEKDLTKEVDKQIRDREQAYQNMYEALRFDTEKYYTYQKGLLEKQRDEEIAITGDLTLAWEAYYARLEALEEAKMLRTNDIIAGMQVYFEQLEREGITWAEASKNMMGNVQAGMASSMQGFLTGVTIESQDFLDTLGDSIIDFLNSILESMFSMYAQMAAKGMMSFFGGFFGTPTPSEPIMVHSGGYIPRYHSGGMSSDEVPTILQRGEYVVSRRGVEALDRINQGNVSAGLNMTVNIQNNTQKPVEAKQKGVRFDGEKYIVDIILQNIDNNGALRYAIAGVR